MFSFTTGDVATSLCGVSAPIMSERPPISMKESPSIFDMSMMFLGPASRSFMVGIKVWPPARSLASSCRANRPAAWRTVVGR